MMLVSGVNRFRQRLTPGTTAAFGLFLLAILAYAGYFVYYALSGLDLPGLLRDANNDDSFYYFQIARNMAEGQFSTFDGGITRTNGYHPVWMWLITPFYWAFDRETALFGIKAFELCLIGGSAALLAVSARLCRLPWVALIAALPLLYQQTALWRGLEAAAGLFALSLLFLSLSLTARCPARWWPLLAAVAFLLPWVRLEYLAISLTATAGAALVIGARDEIDTGVGAHSAALWRRISRLRLGPPAGYAPFLGACLGGLIYFAYNRLLFGGYVPVSGAVKAAWSQEWFERAGGFDFAANLWAHLQYGPISDGLLLAAEISAYALIVRWASRRASSPPHPLLPIFLVGAFALALGHAAKFAQHALTIHPNYNEDWYFVPAYLMMALIIPLRCFVAVYLIKTLVGPRWPNIGRLLTAGTVGVAVIALAATVDFTAPFRHVDRIQQHSFREWEITSYLGTQAMNRLLPDDAVVGSSHAGVIGYFADFPVVNLDGLVNNYAHYRQYITAPEADNPEFNARYGITHYADNSGIGVRPVNTLFEGVSFEPYSLGMDRWNGDREVSLFDFKLWLADPHTPLAAGAPAQQLRTMLQEQADYYSGDAAALVNGNLINTFVLDCTPQQTNVLVFTVSGDFPDDAENKYGSELIYFWNDLRRNNLGYCTAAFELPAAAEHPVSVTAKPFAAAVGDLLQGNRPIIQSDWNVHRIGRQLLYHKQPCMPADTEAGFYLEIIPADANDPLADGWYRDGGSDHQDFDFGPAGGVLHDGRCLVVRYLPGYEIDGINTAQFSYDENALWYGAYYTESYRAAIASDLAAEAAGEPTLPGFFSVYQGDGKLTYVRENCAPADTEALFYLHPVPADVNDLPAEQREHGFDNLDFSFDPAGGVLYQGRCLVSIPLPDYEIHGIRTGQHIPGAGRLWSSEFYTDAYFIPPASEPAAQGYYSIYYGESALTYIREGCAPADTEAIFYLHIIPSDASILPAAQREHGFDNRDFEFAPAGGVQYDGRCLVRALLPDYAIDRIRTGQYRPETGRLWETEFAGRPSP